LKAVLRLGNLLLLLFFWAGAVHSPARPAMANDPGLKASTTIKKQVHGCDSAIVAVDHHVGVIRFMGL